MPFQYTLANLLAHNEGALAVVFLDETGETVDLACADKVPFHMKLTGAYMGIYLRQVNAVLADNHLGESEILQIDLDNLYLYATSLPDGYYLVLVQSRPGLVAQARRTLLQARDEIARAIFS